MAAQFCGHGRSVPTILEAQIDEDDVVSVLATDNKYLWGELADCNPAHIARRTHQTVIIPLQCQDI